MKKFAFFILFLLIATPFSFALSNPITNNGKTYYKVTSSDLTEDTGNEVCAKAGMVCAGYTEKTSSVCKQFNPNAIETIGLSGDSSGVFCNGSPQNGVCSNQVNSCHTCPNCSVGVSCSDPIGNLYAEMYVECVAPSSGTNCSVSLTAANLGELITQSPGLNAQLAACPQPTPSGSGFALSDGETQIDVSKTSGGTQSFVLTKTNGQITGFKAGTSSTCKQKIQVSEDDLNNALSSSSVANAFAYLVGQKKATLTGCSFFSKTKLFFVKPFVNYFAKKQAPSPPPPPPAPNCGNIGEQCNNRGCFSGICGAQKTQNADGRWGYWNYECIATSEWDVKCQAKGNSPAPWSCITGICR